MKKTEIIQEENMDCGVTCLLSIIRYYGGDASLESLRISSNTDSTGVNAYDLIKCANQFGFDAIGKKIKNINKNNLPYIAHVKIDNKYDHFVVIYKIKNDSLYLMDPANGYKWISINDFNKIFDGVIIELTPRSEISNNKINNNILLKNYRKSLEKNKNKLIVISLLEFITLFLSIILSYFASFLETNYSIKVLIIFIIITFSNSFLIYINNTKKSNLLESIKNNTLSYFFKYIIHLPLKYLHTKQKGEILKRFDNLNLITEIIISSFMTIVFNLIIIVVMFILFINTELTFIPILFFVLELIIHLLIYKNINKKVNDVINYETSCNSNLTDSINSLDSIKHSNQYTYFLSHYNYSLNNLLNSKINYIKYSEFNIFIIKSIEGIYQLIFNYCLILNVFNNKLTIINYITLNLLNNIFISSVSNITNTIPSILYIKKLIVKINDFLGIKNKKYKKGTNGNIKINNLAFSYNYLDKIINNINLFIEKGNKVFIKGESGSGKSTLCKILMKEYDNYKGSIFINNKNIRNIDITNIITYSSQEEIIFSDTIMNNITFGNSNTRLFNDIFRICNLNRIINNKTLKLDTFMYGGGHELSGGERELIILARTLYNSKDIIILDEPLSQVDEEIEINIIKNILKYFNKKTIIYISHRNLDYLFDQVISM